MYMFALTLILTGCQEQPKPTKTEEKPVVTPNIILDQIEKDAKKDTYSWNVKWTTDYANKNNKISQTITKDEQVISSTIMHCKNNLFVKANGSTYQINNDLYADNKNVYLQRPGSSNWIKLDPNEGQFILSESLVQSYNLEEHIDKLKKVFMHLKLKETTDEYIVEYKTDQDFHVERLTKDDNLYIDQVVPLYKYTFDYEKTQYKHVTVQIVVDKKKFKIKRIEQIAMMKIPTKQKESFEVKQHAVYHGKLMNSDPRTFKVPAEIIKHAVIAKPTPNMEKLTPQPAFGSLTNSIYGFQRNTTYHPNTEDQ